MRLLGEAIDDRNRRMVGHLPHIVRTEDPNDDRIDVARQHPRGVGDGLAAPELHLGPGQHDRLAAEIAHPDVERDAGAGRRPVEDHRQRLADERTPRRLRALDPRRLHRRRSIEDVAKLAARKLEQVEEMPRGNYERTRSCFASVRRHHQALFDRDASGVEPPHAFGELLVGDDKRRHHAHDVVAGGNDEELLVQSPPRRMSPAGL